jgi:hypothetical protein
VSGEIRQLPHLRHRGYRINMTTRINAGPMPLWASSVRSTIMPIGERLFSLPYVSSITIGRGANAAASSFDAPLDHTVWNAKRPSPSLLDRTHIR